MKKKGYKQMQKRLLRETKARLLAQADNSYNKMMKEFYEKRFRKFGTNVETIEDRNIIECLKWEITPEQWGNYAVRNWDDMLTNDDAYVKIKKILIDQIAEGLIDKNIVQFIVKEGSMISGPFGMPTVGAKLYLVPWEQMPHKRTIEMRQFVENTFEEGEKIL